MKLIKILLAICVVSTRAGDPYLFKVWKQMDFNFPSVEIRQQALSDRSFVPGNSFLVDIAPDYRGVNTRYFVTFPRFIPGIPISLGYIKSGDTLVTPYPSYAFHSSNGGNCDGIVSAFRVAMDSCNQMWVLDSGKIGEDQLCPPQLLLFNLESDEVVFRYQIPQNLYRDVSLMITPVIDVQDPGQCQDVKVYVTDVTGFGLIVYDHKLRKAWRVENRYFFPYPDFGKVTIAGDSFYLMDGIFSLEITKTPLPGDSDRSLLFHSLAAATENSVQLNVLNDAATWEAYVQSRPEDFRVLGSRGIQIGAKAMDSNGNLFFVLLEPLALACWDSSTPYNPNNINIVYRNDTTMQFSSGIKVVENPNGEEELWFITNRLQKYWLGTVSSSEENYRIFNGVIRDLLNGQTRCNGPSLRSYQNKHSLKCHEIN